MSADIAKCTIAGLTSTKWIMDNQRFWYYGYGEKRFTINKSDINPILNLNIMR